MGDGIGDNAVARHEGDAERARGGVGVVGVHRRAGCAIAKIPQVAISIGREIGEIGGRAQGGGAGAGESGRGGDDHDGFNHHLMSDGIGQHAIAGHEGDAECARGGVGVAGVDSVANGRAIPKIPCVGVGIGGGVGELGHFPQGSRGGAGEGGRGRGGAPPYKLVCQSSEYRPHTSHQQPCWYRSSDEARHAGAGLVVQSGRGQRYQLGSSHVVWLLHHR